MRMAWRGRTGQAQEILVQFEALSGDQYVPSMHMGIVHIGLGQNDQAIELLEDAFDEQELWLTWLNVEPRFDPLRSDHRFQELLRRMNFPD